MMTGTRKILVGASITKSVIKYRKTKVLTTLAPTLPFVLCHWTNSVRNIMQILIDRHNKHNTLQQFWSNVGAASTTLAQHYTSIGSMIRVRSLPAKKGLLLF